MSLTKEHNKRQQNVLLPPISAFTSSIPSHHHHHTTSTLLPASPPPSNSSYDNNTNKTLPILPKPSSHQQYSESSTTSAEAYHNHITTTTTTTTLPDQNTLWALFNQFQQQQQQRSTSLRRQSSSSSSSSALQESNKILSSEEVLAEKRRRNAGASARFRDRRKQNERVLRDRCLELEQRVKEVEAALRAAEPDHSLLLNTATMSRNESNNNINIATPLLSQQTDTLVDRVGQLEQLMTRFRQEKETDKQKLVELEQENKYLKSLLVPVNVSVLKSSPKRQYKEVEQEQDDHSSDS